MKPQSPIHALSVVLFVAVFVVACKGGDDKETKTEQAKNVPSGLSNECSRAVEIGSLTVNAAVEGELDAEECDLYNFKVDVTGANRIILTPSTGDADLYISTTADHTSRIDSSTEPGVDSITISTTADAEFHIAVAGVQVAGVQIATYDIEVIGPPNVPSGLSAVCSSAIRGGPINVGPAIPGSVAADQCALYIFTTNALGDYIVTLYPNTGNSDLYVASTDDFNDPEFSINVGTLADRISRTATRVAGQDFHVAVVGVENSDYDIQVAEDCNFGTCN